MPTSRPFILIVGEVHDAPPDAPRCEWCGGRLRFGAEWTDVFDGSEWHANPDGYADPFPGFLDVAEVTAHCPACLASTGAEVIADHSRDMTRWAQEFAIAAKDADQRAALLAQWAREDLEAQWLREHPVLPGLEATHA